MVQSGDVHVRAELISLPRRRAAKKDLPKSRQRGVMWSPATDILVLLIPTSVSCWGSSCHIMAAISGGLYSPTLRGCSMPAVPKWSVSGDWFDVCKCLIPCPCTFAQTPSSGDCEGVLAYHVRQGRYGSVVLDDLNVLAVGGFVGNIWSGQTKATMGFYIDERADKAQRDALRAIWSGEAGRFPGHLRQSHRRDARHRVCAHPH